MLRILSRRGLRLPSSKLPSRYAPSHLSTHSPSRIPPPLTPPTPPPPRSPRPPYRGGYIVRFGSDDPIDRERRWGDMDVPTRDAWRDLGWDENNWDTGWPTPWSEQFEVRSRWRGARMRSSSPLNTNCRAPRSELHELSPKAIAAARRLGYDDRSWENDGGDGTGGGGAGSDLDSNAWKALTVLFAAVIALAGYASWEQEERWRRLKVSPEQRTALKHFIVKTVQHDSLKLREKNLTATELESGADAYLLQLRSLFAKLCDAGTGTISRTSWDAACGRGRQWDAWASDDHHRTQTCAANTDRLTWF